MTFLMLLIAIFVLGAPVALVLFTLRLLWNKGGK
jgi:hypothetical protein